MNSKPSQIKSQLANSARDPRTSALNLSRAVSEIQGSKGSPVLSAEVLNEYSEEFDKLRAAYLQTIESNNVKLGQSHRRHKELLSELDSCVRFGTSRCPLESSSADLANYYRCKLQDLEALIENQRREFSKLLQSVTYRN